MPFFEFPIDDDEPGPRSEESREERWAAELESTPGQQFFGRCGEIVERAIKIKGRYVAIAALAIAGGIGVYIDHALSENPAPAPSQTHNNQPDPCVENLPPGIAARDPSLAMAMIKQCHDRDALGGLFQSNSGTTSSLAGPQN